ncbi:acyl carrier protein [Streptomyces sp. NPDC057686]|uniref:acyl carrier protein n=1 Tax=Streptomyces sp. NPDC057686 TaxID=3346212 RepID=UPI0036989083
MKADPLTFLYRVLREFQYRDEEIKPSAPLGPDGLRLDSLMRMELEARISSELGAVLNETDLKAISTMTIEQFATLLTARIDHPDEDQQHSEAAAPPHSGPPWLSPNKAIDRHRTRTLPGDQPPDLYRRNPHGSYPNPDSKPPSSEMPDPDNLVITDHSCAIPKSSNLHESTIIGTLDQWEDL